MDLCALLDDVFGPPAGSCPAGCDASDGVVECLEGCKIQDGVPLSNAFQTELPASMTAGGRAVWVLHMLDDADVWHTVMTRAR